MRTFRFEQVDGEWRINELQDGIVLSRLNFGLGYREHSVYFFDPFFEYLVPDVRWFPTQSNVPLRIVNALLGGQAEWLQGSTVSAFPEGTTFSPPELIDGVLTVDLNPEIAAASTVDRARMLDQLTRSFTTMRTTVRSVAITAAGAPLPVAEPGLSDAIHAPTVEPSPLVRQGDTFGFASMSGTSAIAIGPKVTALDPLGVALARGRAAAAVLGGDGRVYLVTNEAADPLLIDARPNLIAPSIDTKRFVWSVPSNDPSAVHATGSDGIVHEIASGLPDEGTIVSLAVARDGARLLAYLATNSGPALYVAGIIRDGDGVPTGLGPLEALPVTMDAPIDAAWVDSSTVATLARSDELEVVTEYTVGGRREPPSQVEGAVQLAGGNGTDQLRVRTESGSIRTYRVSGWLDVGIVADLLAVQQ